MDSASDQIGMAVLRLEKQIHEATDIIANDANLDRAETLRLVWGGLVAQFRGTSTENDARHAKWRCRFRLYNMAMATDEPEADSDPDLTPDKPGTQILSGLLAVAEEVIALAAAFHTGTEIRGLEPVELDRKLRGLRPTLSRRRGNAVWRLHYGVADTWRDGDKDGWLARVDIERVGQ